MRTLPRFSHFFIALLLTSTVASAADAPKAATPEAAFENFKAAMVKKDYKNVFGTITPDSQDVLVGGMALNLQVMAMVDPAKYTDGKKLLQKHGIKELDPTQMQATAAKGPMAIMKETVAGVKDKPACFTEMMEWAEKTVPEAKANAGKMADIASSKLSDVKASGDTASGSLKVTQDGKESTQPIKFKKIDDGWFVDFAALVPAGAAGADPGPKAP